MLIQETTKIKGQRAEDHIIEIFRSRGLKLIARNYSVHNVGELDAVFEGKDSLYVVEVRARKDTPGYPDPSESVTAAKRRKIIRTTRRLIQDYDLYGRNVYFLVGQVTLDARGLVQNVEFIPF